MNPLDWSGSQFLMTYVPYLVVMFIAAKLWQRSLNQPSSEPGIDELRLDPYLVAVLDRRTAAVNAALAALVHAGSLRFEEGELKVAGAPPSRASPFERAVHSAVAGEVEGVGDIEEAVDEQLDNLEESLTRRGFLMEYEQATRYRRYPMALFFGAGLGLGLLKLLVGLFRGRPVGFLVLLLALGAVLGFMTLWSVPRRTRRGDRALKLLRLQNSALSTTSATESAWQSLKASDVALSVALFGTGMLMTSGMGDLRGYLMPPSGGGGFGGDSTDITGGSSDFADSGGSSDSGDSGGGGGGDSGGGGGCGGCGGGGGGD
ncbi:TIGR04222 domain-containing membrane protein [Archangium violaceum]|uniref:TIGR04222 domain-containing membrane protein n=1 Tax=Archangium violaceum TaxID=83451 RepID=UPI00194FA682|nr:TIGR04222 domain-containing membrane protein [Archangium violaceum]QRN99386.1 TIGR04222 domain-containing membrane protein [Archangium violaceum]